MTEVTNLIFPSTDELSIGIRKKHLFSMKSCFPADYKLNTTQVPIEESIENAIVIYYFAINIYI